MSMTPEEQAKVMDLLGEPGPFDLGVRFERERIIKLLTEPSLVKGFEENNEFISPLDDCFGCGCCSEQIGPRQIIELIEGENK